MAGELNKAKRKFEVEVGDVLAGGKNKYMIEKLLGEGCYGLVVKCIQLGTEERMAVKLVSKDSAWSGRKEVATLKRLRKLDQNKNLIRFTEHFKHKGHICIAFEMLDIDLYDLMRVRQFKPLSLSEIRVISQQMLVALDALKTLGLAHADIKPDNVMLVNRQLQPFKLKLIDFGLTANVSPFWHNRKIQALGYRAPEVSLGLPLDEAIDMWALGCVLAFLYIGQHLYPTKCEYEFMRIIVQVHGTPEDHLLTSGTASKTFFTKGENSPWRLNTPVEYFERSGRFSRKTFSILDKMHHLEDIVTVRRRAENAAEDEDTRAFMSLLKRMLHVDPRKRITPSKGLGHRFVTMKHFARGAGEDDYAAAALLTMKNSRLGRSADEVKRYVTSSEVTSCTLSRVKNLEGSFSENKGTERKGRTVKDDTGAGKTPLQKTKAARKHAHVKITQKVNPPSKYKTTGFVETKTRRAWLNRMRTNLSRFFRYLSCSRDDALP